MRTEYYNKTRLLFRITILVCMLWFIVCAVAFSNAGSNTPILVMAIYVSVAWGMIWLIRLIVSLWRQWRGMRDKRPLLYWLFEPTAITLTLALSLLGVFSSIRFALSEQSLSSYVESVRAGRVDIAFEFNHPPRQIGLYTVTFTDLLPDGTVKLITSTHRLMDKAGFANSPHSPPPKQGEDSYKHLHQQWWFWYKSW